MQECNEKEKCFAEHYVLTMCPKTAALKAGYSLPTARTRAYQWVSDREQKPWLYDYIQKRLEEKRGQFNITVQQVLHRYWLIASADPNELVELRRVNCRYCHGEGHQYQWTEREFYEAVEEAERKKGGTLPDCAGGFGYDQTGEPAPDCPDCMGEGQEVVHLKDTRDLSPGGRALLAGVKVSQYGIEVKMNSQKDALDMIGKHLGMFIERKELSGPGGRPLLPTEITPDMDAQVAAKAYAELMKSGR